MKLIDPKAAKEYAETVLADPILQMAVRTVLDNAPGVEIVRCEDCRHSDWCGEIPYCLLHECHMDTGSYCSDGERKTNV